MRLLTGAKPLEIHINLSNSIVTIYPARQSVRAWLLLHFQHQALQVLGLRQIQHHRMIGGGAAPLQQPHPPVRIGGRQGRADRLGLSALVYL